MLGRIVVYSISGCPHCLAAKATLQQNGLDFQEIGLDRFKPFVREWVRENTGKTSVPQIFFNSEHIGGNHELQEKWNSAQTRSQLLAILENVPDPDVPLVPDPKDALEADDSDLPQDEAFTLLIQADNQGLFHTNKKEWACGRSVGRSASGARFLDWLQQQKGVEEAEALHTLHTLLDRNLLTTQDRSNLKDAVIYRYEPPEKIGSGLNTDYPAEQGQQNTNAFLVALNIRKLILKLFTRYISEDGKQVDYKGMAASEDWDQFKLLVAQLQAADLNSLSREERLAFFINMYNVLVIHGTVVRGVPTTMYSRYKFFSGVSYIIGGLSYSLNDMENGILRNNRRSMGTLYMRPFSSDDPRLELAIDPVDPRIHFALNCGAKSCPPIKTFSALEIDDQLDLATKAFLENDEGVSIDEDHGVIYLSQLFNWYKQDFGEDRDKILDWIQSHLGAAQHKADAMARLRANQAFKVKYLEYNWDNNEKK